MDGDRGWTRDLRLPLGLAAGQLAVWPLGALAVGAAVDPVRAASVLAATLVTAAALCWRATAPVTVWAVVLGAVWSTNLSAPGGEAFALLCADLVALYTVALRRALRASVLCAVAATLAGIAIEDTLTQPIALTAGDAILSGLVSAAVVGYGRSRRRRTARREAVRLRVAGAAEQERAAAARERERLTQELHDVSAHHLTAAVVQLGAADRLRDPAATAQALDVARTSGRDAARSLHRLVALAGRAEPPAGTADLVAGFARLGLDVELRLDATAVRPDVADAAHRIVQEALTNVLRYAPGATVTVTVAATGDAVTVTVHDTGDGTAADFDLGSGAGIPGMRARAARVHGTLTAGPAPTGGWQVRAVLPAAPAKATAPHRRTRIPLGFDLLLIVLVVALPPFLGAAGVAEERTGPLFADLPDAAATVAFLMGYSAPLWWRRRAPLLVLTAMLAVLLAAAVLARSDPSLRGLTTVVALALIGLAVPVYAAGRHGTGRPGLTWLAALPAGGVAALVLAVLLLRPEDFPDDTGNPAPWLVGAGFLVAVTGPALSLVALPWWLAGMLIARQHARADRTERVALRDVAERAARAARDERARIAEGLRDQVLRHTTALIAAATPAAPPPDVSAPAVPASAGSVPVASGPAAVLVAAVSAADGELVQDALGSAPAGSGADVLAAEGERVGVALGHARAALTAMRELLTVLRVATGAPREAQPTLAGLVELCGSGPTRAVLEVLGAEHPVPLEVELCAFRLVEAVLPVGTDAGAGPARVRVDRGADALLLSVDGLAGTAPRPVLAALRERVDVVGGSLTTARSGAGWRLDVSLPMTEAAPP